MKATKSFPPNNSCYVLDSLKIYVNECLDQINNLYSNLKVFPNPNTGAFTIQSDMDLPQKIDLYNEAGQLINVLHSNLNSPKCLEVVGIKPGFYILRIRDRNFKLVILDN